jgi:catalase
LVAEARGSQAQAGALYRLMKPEEHDRVIANLTASLGRISRDEIIERAIANFRKADPDYGERLAKAVRETSAR